MTMEIPEDLVLFISGVPSAGKTTLSYELLKRYNIFRIVQETDVIREIIRGYNKYAIENTDVSIFQMNTVLPHTELLSYAMCVDQCNIMKYSIKEIVDRQKRKKIPTIINGVHVIPEVLADFIQDSNTIYINLFFDCQDDLFDHLKNRDKKKYGLKSAPFLFDMNKELNNSMTLLHNKSPQSFLSINVGKTTIDDAINIIVNYIHK